MYCSKQSSFTNNFFQSTEVYGKVSKDLENVSTQATSMVRSSSMTLKKTLEVKLEFIYSEKAIKICEIVTLLLSYVVPVKSKVKISQNFVAFSEYMNFAKIVLTYC